MTEFFSGPLAQAVGWALLHLLWQGVLVAAILAASLALLQRQSANARYLASCGALVVIVAMSLLTAYRAYEPIRTADPSFIAPLQNSAPLPVAQPSTPIVLTDVAPALTTYASSHLPQIVFIWLLGVTLLSVRLIIGWVSAHRLAARYAHAAAPQWQLAMHRIAAALDLRRTIHLLESAAVEVPTVVGWLRPVVLLPIATVSGLAAEQIEMILAHELAHIRRHDFIVNLLQSTVETLFFYQPAVWWISRRIRIEREHCCDDLAVAVSGDPVRYARALTRFEELRIDAAQTVLAASGGSLVTRIRRLVGVDGEAASWSSRWAAGAALLVVVVALFLGPALPVFAKHEEAPAPKAKPADDAACKRSSSEIDVQADKDDNADNADDTNIAIPRINVAPIVSQAVRVAPAIAERVTRALAAAPVAIAEAAPRAERRRSHKISEGHLSVDDLITLRNAGVTPQYIDEMRAAGLGNLTLDDIAALGLHGVSPAYLRSLRDAGINVSSADAAVSLRAQGVTGDYVKAMRDAGFAKATTEELIEMRVMGVSPKYMQEMANAGYKNLSARELVELRAQNVSADFVRSLAEAGYTDLSVRDLVRLAASGVNAAFIRDLARYRTKQ